MTAVRIGIDLGSTTCKVIAVDSAGKVAWRLVEPTEPRMAAQAARVIAKARAELSSSDAPVVATGYGRKLVAGAQRVVTEVTCHALGARHRMDRHGVLIDIGGQDTKVMAIDPSGRVSDFAMNDKCAAGTGRFLEVLLTRLQVDWDGVRDLYTSARETVLISSTCTVFAESEVISLLAQEQSVEGIVRGLHDAFAQRVASMAQRFADTASEVFLSGGVARNRAMAEALRRALGKPVLVVDDPQTVGAHGAALKA